MVNLTDQTFFEFLWNFWNKKKLSIKLFLLHEILAYERVKKKQTIFTSNNVKRRNLAKKKKIVQESSHFLNCEIS